MVKALRKNETPSNRPPKNIAPTAAEELHLLNRGYQNIAGLDEVGRGCLAGPVVAAAVILRPQAYQIVGRLAEVRDSKQISPAVREELLGEIQNYALGFGVGVVPNDFIDAHGIAEATRQAMALAVAQLPRRPDPLLIDSLHLPAVGLPQKPILYGDSLCLSIAAASIIAKVHRDRLMCELDGMHPGYGFARNKGYGTPAHLEALQKLGPCGIHRQSFAPVKIPASTPTLL